MEQKQIVAFLVAGFRDLARRLEARGIRVVSLPELEREIGQRGAAAATTGPMWTWKPLTDSVEVSR